MEHKLISLILLLLFTIIVGACAAPDEDMPIAGTDLDAPVAQSGITAEITDEDATETTPEPANPQRTTDDDIRIVELGPLDDSGQATMRIGEDDISLLFNAITADPTDQIIVQEILDPGGKRLYRLIDWDNDEFESELFTSSLYGDGEISIYLPVAPQYDLRPGDYQVQLSTVYGEAIPDAFVIIRSGNPDVPQAINLNVWLVSEDSKVTSSEGQALLSERIRNAVDKILSQHNMRLGQLNFFDATTAHIEAFARTTEDEQPSECQTMAEIAGANRALNMILVDALSPASVAEGMDSDESLAGLSPSPGTVMVPASGTSCVTVSWEAHEQDFDDLGATIIHEGSHFLSLQHTSEQDGLVFDVLEDTPECPANQYDGDDDGVVNQFECEYADGENYMFWGSEGLTTDFVMSEEQAWVLRRHPLFYPIEP